MTAPMSEPMRHSFRVLLVRGSLALALGTAMPEFASESLTDPE